MLDNNSIESKDGPASRPGPKEKCISAAAHRSSSSQCVSVAAAMKYAASKCNGLELPSPRIHVHSRSEKSGKRI